MYGHLFLLLSLGYSGGAGGEEGSSGEPREIKRNGEPTLGNIYTVARRERAKRTGLKVAAGPVWRWEYSRTWICTGGR